MKNKIISIKTINSSLLIALLVFAISSCQKTDISEIITDDSAPATELKFIPIPDVPAIIAVPAGNKVIWHCYATGFQIYKVTQSVIDPNIYLWTFVAPSATLYAKADFTKEVGTHYLGPTWMATTGKKAGEYVVGVKLTGITQDVTAVAWLLLAPVASNDPNYYTDVTYIQRINTTGGLAPTTGADAAHLGEESDVPYTAEYYFYGSE